MARLLQEDDFRFLETQPGFSARMGRNFRAERRRIFRGYLRNMKKDFGQMSLAIKLLMLHAAEDRPDLAAALIRQRLLFALGLLATEARLLLHVVGLGTVDARGIVESFETMQAHLRLFLLPGEQAMVLG